MHCVPLVALGRHHHWSGDGHDKLVKIGFPVWGIQDMWTGKWLKVIIAYLYLSLVAELGGNPFYDHLIDILLILYIFQVYLSNLPQTVVVRPQRYMDSQMHLGIFKMGYFFAELMLTSHGNILGRHLHLICQLLTLQHMSSSRAFIIQLLNTGGCIYISSGEIM